LGTALLPQRIDLKLRPGERASVCWHNEGRWPERSGERQPIPLAKVSPYFGNGAIVYQPTLGGEAGEPRNLLIEPAEGGTLLRAEDPYGDAGLTYALVCPYLLSACEVTGEYTTEREGALSAWLSFDEGASWAEVWRSDQRTGRISLDLSDQIMARYDYRLRLDLAGGTQARVSGLTIRSVFIASPLALPDRLKVGDNRLSFVAGPATEPVIARLAWVERYRSDLGVGLNSVSYYNMDDENHRDLFVAGLEQPIPIRVTLMGRAVEGEVRLEGLPEGWCEPAALQVKAAGDAPETVEFTVTPRAAAEAAIVPFEVVVREGERERRVRAELLVAAAPLVAEAETAQATGDVAATEDPAMSGAAVMTFTGDGELGFDADVLASGQYAVWLRLRRDDGASSGLALRVDDQSRDVRLAQMIGFTDWDDPSHASGKMFAHYGEAYGHWNWYRIPAVELEQGRRRIGLGAHAGMQCDAIVVLPQTDAVDRASMNLLHNWTYAPWDRPL
ncbi:MAG TPA: hypothetical protein VM283_09070, partial [Armatimonadota bacterium]|nr:hypothetical protein [Armatimonadota bacterium]